VLPRALLPLASVVVIVLLWRGLWSAREDQTFLLGIVLFLLGFGERLVLWPYVVSRQATIWTAAADRSAPEFVGAGLVVLLPVILTYLGHAYWVFRGKVAAAYGEASGEPRVEAKSDNLAS
jgi:cytochrome d ubiquinol oxidase subunit II